jgi:uncharacterized protein YegL
MPQPKGPGGVTKSKELHFFWLLDGSGSMQGEKIEALNYAIAEAIPGMQEAAGKNPEARVLVHALRFASDVEWISQNGAPFEGAPEPIPLSKFKWKDDFIKAIGDTHMGEALSKVADELDQPILILVTDGHATDNFDEGLRKLMAQRLGKHAIRLAVGIGDEFDGDRLKKFVGDEKIPIIVPDAAKKSLADRIKFISTTAIVRSSQPIGAPAKDPAKDDVWKRFSSSQQ